MRSLDQLYIGRRPEQHIALLASDAAVPYRTSARLIEAYHRQRESRVSSPRTLHRTARRW